jgi:ketosteroid isomerase-like protein
MSSSLQPSWLREHYERVDANDFAYLREKFAEDAEVRFGNRPPAVGRQAIASTLADFHSPFVGSLHRFVDAWYQGHLTLIAFDVSYMMNDGSEVRIETFTILECDDELIKRMHVYIDEGPLRGR